MEASAGGLQRFVLAQEPVYAQVCRELSAGTKTSHWMWFIFPQLRGLGRSSLAEHFGIESMQEAQDYLAHPVLGARLKTCTQLLLAIADKSAHEILGTPDDLKLCSCLTLFNRAAPEEPVFMQALARFYDGRADPATLALLAS